MYSKEAMMDATCVDCGGPRHRYSAKRCRKCHALIAKANAENRARAKSEKLEQARENKEIMESCQAGLFVVLLELAQQNRLRSAINSVLCRLVNRGELRRVGWGVYFKVE